jgi:hypothetical protein
METVPGQPVGGGTAARRRYYNVTRAGELELEAAAERLRALPLPTGSGDPRPAES